MASPRDLVEVEVDKEAQARLILPAPNTNLEEASIAYRSSTCGDWIGRRAALTRLTSLALSRDESSDLALHTFPLPKIAAVHVTPGQWAQTPSQKQMTHVAAPTGMDFDAALQRCKHFFDHEMMRDHACSDITPSNPTIAECHSEQDRRERALARDRVRWMQAAEEEAECVQGVLHVARQRKRDIPRVRSEAEKVVVEAQKAAELALTEAIYHRTPPHGAQSMARKKSRVAALVAASLRRPRQTSEGDTNLTFDVTNE